MALPRLSSSPLHLLVQESFSKEKKRMGISQALQSGDKAALCDSSGRMKDEVYDMLVPTYGGFSGYSGSSLDMTDNMLFAAAATADDKNKQEFIKFLVEPQHSRLTTNPLRFIATRGAAAAHNKEFTFEFINQPTYLIDKDVLVLGAIQSVAYQGDSHFLQALVKEYERGQPRNLLHHFYVISGAVTGRRLEFALSYIANTPSIAFYPDTIRLAYEYAIEGAILGEYFDLIDDIYHRYQALPHKLELFPNRTFNMMRNSSFLESNLLAVYFLLSLQQKPIQQLLRGMISDCAKLEERFLAQMMRHSLTLSQLATWNLPCVQEMFLLRHNKALISPFDIKDLFCLTATYLAPFLLTIKECEDLYKKMAPVLEYLEKEELDDVAYKTSLLNETKESIAKPAKVAVAPATEDKFCSEADIQIAEHTEAVKKWKQYKNKIEHLATLTNPSTSIFKPSLEKYGIVHRGDTLGNDSVDPANTLRLIRATKI